ncbi:MAG: hypothetical protein ACR2PK_02080 [Acidimicrobiales bacterium]
MELPLFDQVDDLVRAMTPEQLGTLKTRVHRRGIKIWFETEKAPPLHYEAQVLNRRHVDGTEGGALEIGLHAEHGDEAANDAIVQALSDNSVQWRRSLGSEAEIGSFFGAEGWRRVSEAWIEPDLDDPETALAIAARVVDYIDALEPHVRRLDPEDTPRA